MDVTLSTILLGLALIAFRLASTEMCFYKERSMHSCSAGCCFTFSDGVESPCCPDPIDDIEIDIVPIVAPIAAVTVVLVILIFVVTCYLRRRRIQNERIIDNARNNPHSANIGHTYVPPAGYTTVVDNPLANMAMGSHAPSEQEGQPLMMKYQHPTVSHQHPTVYHHYSPAHDQNPTVRQTAPWQHPTAPPTDYWQHPTAHGQHPTAPPTDYGQHPTAQGQHPTAPPPDHGQHPTAHGQHPTPHGQHLNTYDVPPPAYQDVMSKGTGL